MDPSHPYLDFDPPLEAPGDKLEEAALAFHQRNPHVLQEIASVSLRVKRAGRRRWSVNADVTTDHRTYKLNNNHRAFYARWLMRDIPELSGFFSTRDTARVPQEYDE